MRTTIFILLLFQTGLMLAQPVTRIRLISLQDPPDTTQQWVIQGGNFKDTIKWVPIDSLPGGGAGSGGIYGGDGSLSEDVVVDMNNYNLDFQDAASNSLLFIDETNARIGVNWATPTTSMHISGTDGIRIPVGTTAQRPAAISNDANVRMNSTLQTMEFVAGNAYYQTPAVGDDRALGDNTNGNHGFADRGAIIQISDASDNSTIVTYTLPGSPEDQEDVYCECKSGSVIDANDGCRIVGNGNNINGSANYTFSNAGMTVYLRYSSTLGEWKLIQADASVPDAPDEGYALSETASPDLQNIGTTWEALEAQTSPTNSTDWSFATGTDLFTYNGMDAEKYLISFSVCYKFSTSTFREIHFTVQENGTDGNAKATSISGADSGVTDCVPGFDIVTANNGDTFGLGMALETGSATNVTIESSQLAITKLVGQ